MFTVPSPKDIKEVIFNGYSFDDEKEIYDNWYKEENGKDFNHWCNLTEIIFNQVINNTNVEIDDVKFWIQSDKASIVVHFGLSIMLQVILSFEDKTIKANLSHRPYGYDVNDIDLSETKTYAHYDYVPVIDYVYNVTTSYNAFIRAYGGDKK